MKLLMESKRVVRLIERLSKEHGTANVLEGSHLRCAVLYAPDYEDVS